MEIEYARSIPLTKVLDRLGQEPTQQKNDEYTYRSIVSKDKKSNLIINITTNTWHDSSTGKGGDIIDLVTAYLEVQGENYTVKDALRWLRIMCGYAAEIEPIKFEENIPKHEGMTVVATEKLHTRKLIRHVESYHIPILLAVRHLKEVRIYDKPKRKTIRALGFRNEDGGYFAFNADFLGFVGKQNITHIRGTKSTPERTHVFKDIFDYMSVITGFENGAPFEDDAFILNSYANLPEVARFMRGFGCRQAFTWLGNDTTGQEATAALSGFFKTEPDLKHSEMNNKYIKHKNVHAWYRKQRLHTTS